VARGAKCCCDWSSLARSGPRCSRRREVLASERSSVKTCALQPLFELSSDDVVLRGRNERLLCQTLRKGTPAMRARARKLLSSAGKPKVGK
jgi:hypothetical protein